MSDPQLRTRKPPPAGSTAAGITAIVLQVLVAGFTLFLGVGWVAGAAAHLVALGQAVLALGVTVWLAARRRRLVLLVPVVSLSLTFLLQWAGTQIGQAAACSELERSLVAELAAPPGVDVELRGGNEGSCLATFTTDLDAEEVIAHYEAEFDTHGWRVITGQGSSVGLDGIAALKDGIVVDVSVEELESRGLVALAVREKPPDVDYDVCTPNLISAITQLIPPPGTPPGTPPTGHVGRGCWLGFGIDVDRYPMTPAQLLDHYRDQLGARGWQILRDSTAELTASDGEIHLTIHAELYPEEPREPYSLNVSITASDALTDAP